ncbi:vanadium-dependent haloperoxidase [Lunatimonas salinarum]|uniref:vanadium-dependent haloperoxidase n=1 Tax=Lunatimonas salinarum TaxID=1774590 RepID=UPI001FD7A077|nr:vanadium-dependent haloperoxidase [Lunatimonas salinarum]
MKRLSSPVSIHSYRPALVKPSARSPFGRQPILLGVCILLLAFACTGQREKPTISLPAGMIGWITESMTDLMVNDITNPPLAARFYAYAALAGYEVVSQEDTLFQSMAKVLNDYPDIPAQNDLPNQHTQVSAALAMIEVASAMQPSGSELLKLKQSFLDSCSALGIEKSALSDSEAYAKRIAQHILAYAKSDRYAEISNYPRYTPSEVPGSWYPTPPGYFAPVEPYFNTIRPFSLVKADQFKPIPPVSFSENPHSDFFRLMRQVYEVDLTTEARTIAAFWDCNPFALEETGHLMVGLKQISPGGHWIGITDIACRQAGVGFNKAMEITAVVSVGLMDGFLSCWDEKYRSNRIRPETAIRKYLDPTYTPLLQTPPFPEYLSGHSTISTTSAEILTHFFGDGFAYTDTVEEKYHLGRRDFNSFYEAANEASISRLYGGIHYIDAIEVGQEQGKKVGEWIIAQMTENGIANPLSK